MNFAEYFEWDLYCVGKYDPKYYSDHIVEVEQALANDLTFNLMSEEDQMITRYMALGHDLLEDTDATIEEMKQYVSDIVIAGIVLLTKQPNEKYEDYIRRIMICGDERVILVKKADMYDHIIKKKRTLTERLKNKYEPILPYLTRMKRWTADE